METITENNINTKSISETKPQNIYYFFILSAICPIFGFVFGIVQICRGKTSEGIVYMATALIAAAFMFMFVYHLMQERAYNIGYNQGFTETLNSLK